MPLRAGDGSREHVRTFDVFQSIWQNHVGNLPFSPVISQGSLQRCLRCHYTTGSLRCPQRRVSRCRRVLRPSARPFRDSQVARKPLPTTWLHYIPPRERMHFSRLSIVSQPAVQVRHSITAGNLSLLPAPAATRMPRIAHFIFGLSPDFGKKPFSLVHYLAIRSAHDRLGPKWKIFVRGEAAT